MGARRACARLCVDWGMGGELRGNRKHESKLKAGVESGTRKPLPRVVSRQIFDKVRLGAL